MYREERNFRPRREFRGRREFSDNREERMDSREEEQDGKEEIVYEETGVGMESKGIVVPGEVVATGQNYLPGDGTRRDGKDIVASRFGILQTDQRTFKIIPLSGVYVPRRGNIVIGRITDITFNGWMVDINSPYNAFLLSTECSGFISKRDLASYYNFGELIIAQIKEMKSRGVDLTMRERGMHKIEEGIVITINSNKVPRVIGKMGSMINIIKQETECNIVVGQNGVIWIRGPSIEHELLAEKTIKMIAEKSFVEGLTDKVKVFLEKEKGKLKKEEKKEQ